MNEIVGIVLRMLMSVLVVGW